jgi:hypothetical protein
MWTTLRTGNASEPLFAEPIKEKPGEEDPNCAKTKSSGAENSLFDVYGYSGVIDGRVGFDCCSGKLYRDLSSGHYTSALD